MGAELVQHMHAELVQHMHAGAPRARPSHVRSSDVAGCMCWAVELDRALACEERGYKTVLFKLIQPQLSAKNDLLIGAPADNHIAAVITRVWDACPLLMSSTPSGSSRGPPLATSSQALEQADW